MRQRKIRRVVLMVTRRSFMAGAAAAMATPTYAQAPAGVDGWPSRPIRVVFPTGPGGPSENFRLYAEYLKAKFGQPLLLENMPGRSEEHTSELQSLRHLVCRLLLE